MISLIVVKSIKAFTITEHIVPQDHSQSVAPQILIVLF
jgi:hypothetical protein